MFVAACAAVLAFASFRVETDHSMVWSGQTYQPIGLWVQPNQIDRALAGGIRDLVVELPSSGKGWAETFSKLDAAQARYLVAVSDPVTQADATLVEPEYYRIPHQKEQLVLDESLPGCHDALVAWNTTEIGASPEHVTLKEIKGHISVNRALPGANIDFTAMVFPTTRKSGLTDFWEGLDKRRDALLQTFQEVKPGPGYRGLIDPLGPGAMFPQSNASVVPVSHAFRNEFSAWLAQNYQNPKFVARAWGLGANDLRRFDDYAAVVPLWSASKGISRIWSPRQDAVYYASPVGSRLWPDLDLICRTSAERRYSRLVAMLRRVTGGPVVQSWSGWEGPYEGTAELDGVLSTPSGGADSLSNAVLAASSLNRRPFPTWGVNVVGFSPASALFYKKLTEDTASLGFRSLFVRVKDAEVEPACATLKAMAWPTTPTAPVTYYPLWSDVLREDAWRGNWWSLPLPTSGRRIDALGAVDGYHYTRGTGRVAVLWSRQGESTVSLRAGEGSEAVATDAMGKVLVSGRAGFKLQLGPEPTTVSLKGPEPADQGAIEAYANMIRFLVQRLGAQANPTGSADVALRTAADLVSRAPSQALTLIRDEAEAVCARSFPIAWFEIRRPEAGSDGVLASTPGSRKGLSWSLDQAFAPREGVSAEWMVAKGSVRKGTLWVAARVPEGQGDKIDVLLNGTKAGTLTDPIGGYGPGFAWYKLANLPFGQKVQRVKVTNRSTVRGVAVDAILLTPYDFTPDGGRFPFGMVEREIRTGKLGE